MRWSLFGVARADFTVIVVELQDLRPLVAHVPTFLNVMPLVRLSQSIQVGSPVTRARPGGPCAKRMCRERKQLKRDGRGSAPLFQSGPREYRLRVEFPHWIVRITTFKVCAAAPGIYVQVLLVLLVVLRGSEPRRDALIWHTYTTFRLQNPSC